MFVESLEERSCPSVTFGAVGDSASDEWSVIGITGYYTWIEFLNLTGAADFGEITNFPSGDPRGVSGGIGFEYNYAAYGATTQNYLGQDQTFSNPPRVVENYHSQVGSPTHPDDWGGVRKLGLDGTIEYLAFFIGESDLLNILGPTGLADGPRPDIIDGVISRITQGLDIATANQTSPVKVILLQLHDLAQLPAWDPFNFTAQENANIAANVLDYNSKLETLANNRGYGLVNLANLWNQAISPEGLVIHGWQIDPYDTETPGESFEGEDNFFIIDGFHPTPIIHAMWANMVLEEIIDHFGETDVELFTDKELVHYSGLDPQDAPIAIASGPYTLVPENSLALNAFGSYDPDLGDVLSYSWDINGDGVFGDAVGVDPTLTWAELVALGIEPSEVYNVRVQVDDGFSFDNITVSDPVTLTVASGPPVANAGGTYSAQDGEAILLSGEASTDATEYAWDLDNDGEYDDAFGPTAIFTATLGGITEVGLFVIGPNGSDTDTATIEITNAIPSVGLIGTQQTLRGQTSVFVVAAYDPSPTQMAAGFTYEFDWDGDGDVDETVQDASLAVFLHTFSTVGDFNVAVRAVDDLGAASPWAVNPVSVVNDPPIAFVQSLTPAVRGQQTVFIVGAYDLSPLDLEAGFTYQIDWNGNGTVDQTVNGPYLAIVLHTFSTVGQFTVKVRAVDVGGAISDWTSWLVNVTATGGSAPQSQSLDASLLLAGRLTTDDPSPPRSQAATESPADKGKDGGTRMELGTSSDRAARMDEVLTRGGWDSVPSLSSPDERHLQTNELALDLAIALADQTLS